MTPKNKFSAYSPARKVALLGILAGLAIVLGMLEGLLPPLPFLPPGAKAGFSNIVTMFAAAFLGLPGALAIAAVKSLFVLLTRGGSAFFMSLAGGMLSTAVMWLLFRLCKGKLGLIGVGIAGAVAHNTAQLAVSILLTGTPALFYYYPALLLFALAAGTVTGLLLRAVLPVTRRLRLL